MEERGYDVVVVGGGPAGSTAGAVLARHGRRVLVLEKDKFPRYHIGESLMPYCWFTLDRLGLAGRMAASHFPKKYSVQFVSTNGKASQPFYFFQHYDHPSSTTWQVLRSEFDQMLLENARAAGAEVMEETRATDFLRDGAAVAGVRAVSKAGEALQFRAPLTIDASGRDALGVNRNRWRASDPNLKKIALWTYYRGALRDPGLDEGATTVAFLPDKGWFWYIPLHDDLVSVGIVAEHEYLFRATKDRGAIFDREAEVNPWVKEHLATGRRVNAPGLDDGPFYTTSEWSYRSAYGAADGLILAGDAFGFLDPVFSSGIFLALKSGELAADAAHEALAAGDVSAPRFAGYAEQVSRGMESMRKLVYAFYDREFSMREFVTRYPHLRGDVTDCLIGNLMRDFTDLFAAVGEFARLPEPAAHGRPFGA